MDLWLTVARLRRRPMWLVIVALAAAAVALIGWFGTKPNYSVTASDVVTMAPASAGAAPSTGSYEVGVIASMLATNATSHVDGSAPGVKFSAINSSVAPPTNLPLISMTATATSGEDAVKAISQAQQDNADFLAKIAKSSGTTGRLSIVHITEPSIPSGSSQPRIRAAGAGLITTALAGLLVLLALDALSGRRQRRTAA